MELHTRHANIMGESSASAMGCSDNVTRNAALIKRPVNTCPHVADFTLDSVHNQLQIISVRGSLNIILGRIFVVDR